MISTAETLIELARAARGASTEQVLEAVADAFVKGTDYKTCVVNVYRRAWDDYEVVVVRGEREVRQQLMGGRYRAESLRGLLDARHERIPGVFFVAADDMAWQEFNEAYHLPDLPARDHPNSWRSEDALLILLADSDGVPLGFVSLDEPLSGMRPTEGDLELCWTIAQYAEQALETAMINGLRLDAERVWRALVRSGTSLANCENREQLAEVLISTVVEDLPFERAAAYARRDEDWVLRLRRHHGWDGQPGWLADELDPDHLLALLDRDGGEEQCWLLPARELFPQQPPGVRSQRNGDGPGGWNEQCMVVPVIVGDELVSVLVVEDPSDHAAPSAVRRRALRIVMDQATVAVDLIRTRQSLEHLANHDPLTGLRNRRDLDAEILRHKSVAVLICDLDRFKAINDQHGHALGDAVLREFGDLLRSHSRHDDAAIRMGGEEFCLIMPRTGPAQAAEAAERLRAAVEEGLYELVPGGVTVSIGVACSEDGLVDVDDLLARADRALYVAKHTGRNRVELAGVRRG